MLVHYHYRDYTATQLHLLAIILKTSDTNMGRKRTYTGSCKLMSFCCVRFCNTFSSSLSELSNEPKKVFLKVMYTNVSNAMLKFTHVTHTFYSLLRKIVSIILSLDEVIPMGLFSSSWSFLPFSVVPLQYRKISILLPHC